jgi:peptide/nickel transport system permease protein
VSIPSAILALIVLACFAGPFVFGLPNPDAGNLQDRLLPIGSPGHLLGTNNLGNDMLSRLLHGGQVSIIVGVVATAIGFSIGVVLGTIAGYYRGAVEATFMRIFDVLFAFPGLILALAIATYLGPSLTHTIWAIAFFGIAGFGRLARGLTVRVRNLEYVRAARVAGARGGRIVFGHILPNILPPLMTFAMFGVGVAMVAEAGLSFLGLGIQIPRPSWGNLIASGQDYLSSDPMLIVLPAVALFITVLCINLVTDSLRDRLGLER